MFFLKNLKFLQNNLSLAELSRKTNISYRTLQDIYANNSNNPKADTLIKISQSYNISIDKLLLCDLEKELEEKQQWVSKKHLKAFLVKEKSEDF